MRHLRQVGHIWLSRDVLAERHWKFRVAFRVHGALDNLAEEYAFLLDVRNFYADNRLSGHRREYPHGVHPHGEGYVVREVRNLVDLYAGRGFEFVGCDDRAGPAFRNVALDLEVQEVFLQNV